MDQRPGDARQPQRVAVGQGADVALCGVMGALSGGVLAASSILGRNLMSVVSRGAAHDGRPALQAA